MAKTITPIVGLAVVVALALAAVFGSMSLANPAMAAIGQPADAELTERTDSPQSAPTLMASGSATSVLLTYDNQRDPGSANNPKTWFTSSDWQYRYRANIADEAYGAWATTSAGETVVTTTGTSPNDTSVVTTTISSLTNGQEYRFQVRLLDADGSTSGGGAAAGPVSNVASATPVAAPDGAAPTLEAEPSEIGGAVDLEWEYEDGDDVPATGWQYASVASGGTLTASNWKDIPGDGAVRSHTVTELAVTAVDHYVRPLNATSPGAANATAAAATPRSASVINLQATAGDGNVRLTWNPVTSSNTIDVAGTATPARYYNYEYYPTADKNSVIVTGRAAVGASRGFAEIDDLSNNTEYTFNVYLHTTETAGESSGAARIMATPAAAAVIPVKPQAESFSASSMEPGKNTRYTFKFNADMDYVPGVDDISVEFNEDFSVPGSIDESSVTIQLGSGSHVVNPSAVIVDGEEVILELGDLNEENDDDSGMILMNQPVTVIFKASAGISNPTEGGGYDEIKAQDVDYAEEFMVLRTLGIDPDDGGRGDTVTATGKGFKNGTSLLVFLDENEDNVLNSGEDTLCTAIIGGDDVGSCEFEITNPPFGPGDNRISAVDGRSNRPDPDEWDTFALDPSMSATPSEGTPGDAILVQLSDFAAGDVTQVRVARQDYCNDDASKTAPFGSCDWNVGATGEVNFQITVPDWAPTGKIDLRVDVDPTAAGVEDQDASLLLTISGPSVSSTPAEVIANQRVSLVGDGFNNGATIKEITIGGEVINPSRINGGQTVHVDNGGGWSASVNLPLSEATTSEGVRQVRVTDSMDRVGTVPVTVKSRTVTITPDTGRVGTIAVVRGEGFPSRNDEGSSFNVEIVYDAGDGETTVSAQPNAGGIFETQLRIPTTADIPSTNTVRVTFDTNLANGRRGGPPVITTVSHDVPEGAIFLSETSGASGSMITVTGEGFKAYVPVQEVHVGSIEVTPSPTPSTDAQGMLEFEILIPGLEDGIQTIEVQVSGTTASRGFTVTPSGVASGGIVGVANGVEPLGDNVVSVWNFNNDTKVWSFYDPTLAEGNTLTHLISGETYLVRIESNAEVILNNETRNLTCVADNCWNQIVW